MVSSWSKLRLDDIKEQNAIGALRKLLKGELIKWYQAFVCQKLRGK